MASGASVRTPPSTRGAMSAPETLVRRFPTRDAFSINTSFSLESHCGAAAKTLPTIRVQAMTPHIALHFRRPTDDLLTIQLLLQCERLPPLPSSNRYVKSDLRGGIPPGTGTQQTLLESLPPLFRHRYSG